MCLTLGPLLFFKIYPPKAIKFKSMDFNLSINQMTDPGRTDLVKNIEFDTKSLVVNSSRERQAVTCPDFDPVIRRYSWTPYSKGDILIVKYNLTKEVVKVTINDQFHNLKEPISIPFRKASEYFIKFYSSDSSFSSYVVVATPIDFAPLTGKIIDPSKVHDGYILSDFNPNNLNSIFKQIWMSLYYFGFSTFSNIYSLSKSVFSEEVIQESTRRLDKRRKYNPYFFVLDKYGVPVYLKSNNLISGNFQKTDSGYSIGVSRIEPLPGVFYGKNLILDSKFKEIEEKQLSRVRPNLKSDSHVFYETKSNSYVLKAHSKSKDKTSGENIFSFYFQEQNKNGEILFEWDSKDHFNSSLSWISKDRFPTWDYFYGTSINPTIDNNFIISSVGLKSVMKIDRESGRAVWMLGDRDHGINDFTYIDDEFDGPSVVHYATQLPNGNILLFDNGDWMVDISSSSKNYKNPNLYSRVVEYKLNDVDMTATKVLEIRYSNNQAHIGGSAVRLSNGNTLVAWGSMGYISEYDESGELVLDLDFGGTIYKAVKVVPHHLMKSL